jgi:hypothetical protein
MSEPAIAARVDALPGDAAAPKGAARAEGGEVEMNSREEKRESGHGPVYAVRAGRIYFGAGHGPGLRPRRLRPKVPFVCGDIKVVDKSTDDGIFINTSGVRHARIFSRSAGPVVVTS